MLHYRHRFSRSFAETRPPRTRRSTLVLKSSTSTGKFFEPLVTDQQDDRKLEAAAAHEVNERSGLALQAFFAPVDHHASDRRVGLYRDLCVLERVRPDDLEARTLDLADNLIEADTLEIIRIKVRCREQECEASVASSDQWQSIGQMRHRNIKVLL